MSKSNRSELSMSVTCDDSKPSRNESRASIAVPTLRRLSWTTSSCSPVRSRGVPSMAASMNCSVFPPRSPVCPPRYKGVEGGDTRK
ncbi:MAG TPA: hypothetical protein VMB46_04305 [Methanomassiliicoccales archaeon]|nr:hypothetical protein [Methanomassiliicoccales archaeon]